MDLPAPSLGAARALLGVAAGEPAAWSWLCERYAPPVLGIARAIAGADDAEDVCQEVFLRLRRHANRFGGDEAADAHADAWIRRVAVNACLSWRTRGLRRARRERTVSALPEATMGAEPHDHDDVQLQHALLKALAGLGEGDRLLVTRRFWEGVPHGQLASELGVKTVTIRVRLHRALERLRQRLAGAGIALSAAALPARLEAVGSVVLSPSSVAAPAGLAARLQALPPSPAGGARWLAFGAAAVLALAIGGIAVGDRGGDPFPASWRTGPASSRSAAPTAGAVVPASPVASHAAAIDGPASILVSREAGPLVRLQRARSQGHLERGEILEEATARSLRLTWSAADACPPVLGEGTGFSVLEGKPFRQQVDLYEAFLPEPVRRSIGHGIVVVDRDRGLLSASPASLWTCVGITREGDRFVATLVHLRAAHGWLTSGEPVHVEGRFVDARWGGLIGPSWYRPGSFALSSEGDGTIVPHGNG